MRHSSVVLLAVCFIGVFASAQVPDLDQNKAEFVTVPALIHQVSGKYPDTHMVVFYMGCQKGIDGELKAKLKTGTDYSVQVSGAGMKVSSVKREDDCTVSFDLTTTSTDHGPVVATVSAGADIQGKAFLQFVDPLAGPTPGRPEVDVLWAPISYDVCNRAFGRSVAEKFWCIAVKIGNNSGYQLQIAGVGFRTTYGRPGKSETESKTPNSSYALTRAVEQEGLPRSGRAIVLHSMEATGLLMAGFAPYFHNERSSTRYGTANSIVSGPLQAALNVLWPDPSVQQGNNLDDQSLRDGKLIPNNTQITTVLFLDKGSVLLDYKRACDDIFKSYDKNEGDDKATASCAKHNVKAVTVTTSDCKKDPALDSNGKPINRCFPKMDVCQVSDRIFSEEQTAGKSYQSCVKGKLSSGLKAALGDLVLVGDEIQFLQRVVVDQSVHSQEVPAVARLSKATLDCKTLSITGANLNSLPNDLIVQVNGQTKTASKPTLTASTAVYSIDSPFPSGGAFTIQSVGTQLPEGYSGVVANTIPNLKASSNGNTITVQGDHCVDGLPDPLLVTVDSSLYPLHATTGSLTDISAKYEFPPSKTAKAPYKLTIATQLGLTLPAPLELTVPAP